MGFLSKLIDKINGQSTEPQPASAPEKTQEPKPDKIQEPVAAKEETVNIKQPEPAQKSPADNVSPAQTANDNDYTKDLDSDSPYKQRFAWHCFLADTLSNIDIKNYSILKYFTVYITRRAGSNYSWADESFKKELLKELERFDCASHIGISSFNIEIISDKETKAIKAKANNPAFFFLEKGHVIFFGSKTMTDEQKFATAIDKRAFVIKELIKKFRNSTGTDSKLLENLTIIVIKNEDDDLAKFDWIGTRFEEDLKRELANAFLDQIGSKSLQIVLLDKSQIGECTPLIDNHIYYRWDNAAANNTPVELPYKRVVAYISVIGGTGSLASDSYTLDSDKKKTYYIGRGVTSRKGGKFRVNDIIIKDTESDETLSNRNAFVSSTHADIIFKNNQYYIKAAVGGCRASGGSPTKIFRDEKETELRDITVMYPLCDGDIIELGKSVALTFSLASEEA